MQAARHEDCEELLAGGSCQPACSTAVKLPSSIFTAMHAKHAVVECCGCRVHPVRDTVTRRDTHHRHLLPLAAVAVSGQVWSLPLQVATASHWLLGCLQTASQNKMRCYTLNAVPQCSSAFGSWVQPDCQAVLGGCRQAPCQGIEPPSGATLGTLQLQAGGTHACSKKCAQLLQVLCGPNRCGKTT